jgi:hypothetical protein
LPLKSPRLHRTSLEAEKWKAEISTRPALSHSGMFLPHIFLP